MANRSNSLNSISKSSFSSGNFNDIIDEFGNNNNNTLTYSKLFGKRNSLKKEVKIRYYICNGKCKSCPKIIFEDDVLNVYCGCKEILNITLKDFNDKYSHKDLKDIEAFLCCKKHTLKVYKTYCHDDKENLCGECLKIFKKHENHSHDPLLSEKKMKNIESIKDIIKEKRKIIPKGDTESRGRLNLIESLLECYKNYPCHYTYESIKSGKKYLENLKIKEIKERLKINSEIELKENIYNSYLFSEINISEQNFNNLSIFKELDLRNLKILKLNENGINNIDPLYNCNFEELEVIHLEGNKLNYQSIRCFSEMKFKNIKFINLFINEIESPQIFEKIMIFKTLLRFDVGLNKFTNEEIIKNSNIKYDLKHLKKIGLSGNFTDENIHFILNLNFSNLEYLYLNKSNLSSLFFLKDINCPNLVSFWARENHLTDYKEISELKYKDKLKRINLKDNDISNIDDLIVFISNFPSLNSLNSSNISNILVFANNKINLDNDRNKQIIKEIHNAYYNLKLIMEITNENKIYLEEEYIDENPF